MIEDKEIAELFNIECAEHLQQIETGLLQVEKGLADNALVEKLFREAHSLKGSSRMLGVVGVQTLSHHMEDIFGEARENLSHISAQSIEAMYRCLEAIKKLVDEAVSGKSSGVDVNEVIALLKGSKRKDLSELDKSSANNLNQDDDSKLFIPLEQCTAEYTPSCNCEKEVSVKNECQADGNSTERQMHVNENERDKNVLEKIPVHKTVSENKYTEELESYKIDTIRVDTKKLDTLITHCGELSVVKTSINHHLSQITDILDFCQNWSNELNAFSSFVNENKKMDSQNTYGQLYNLYTNEQKRLDRLGELIERLKDSTSNDSSRLDFVTKKLDGNIRNVRLLSLSTVFKLFPKMVRDLSKSMGKEVVLKIEGGGNNVDKRILEEIKAPLTHIIRNAIDHGVESKGERLKLGKRETAVITLKAYKVGKNIVIEVSDDGRGFDAASIKQKALDSGFFSAEELSVMNEEQIKGIIFLQGFSTNTIITDISGRGVGLDVVKNNIERLKGSISVDSIKDKGAKFTIKLPVALTTTRVFIVSVYGIKLAIPVDSVRGALNVENNRVYLLEGKLTIDYAGNPVTVARLSQLLEIKDPGSGKPGQHGEDSYICIVLDVGQDRFGIFVDDIIDEQEVVLKTYGNILKRVRNIAGATILETGEVCMLVNTKDIAESMNKTAVLNEASTFSHEETKKQCILLVEDTITTRILEKRILEGAGFNVDTAVDGVDALSKIKKANFDAVVTDVQMPNMNGLELTATLRKDDNYKELPIVLVTSLASDEDKKKGIQAGANAYITKPAFDHKVFLDSLKRIL